MSKYKVYRPFRRRINGYLNPFNITFTIFMWIFFAIGDFLRVFCKVLWWDLTYIYNFIHYRKINYSSKQIEQMIRDMSPREFEVFVAEVYKRLGYDVELTQATADGGKDVILRDFDEDEVIYVECKHYSECNSVGREICQKLLGAMIMDNVDRGIIVNTGVFNKNAWEVYSKVDNLEFIDMKQLMVMIRKLEVHELPRMFMKTLQPSV